MHKAARRTTEMQMAIASEIQISECWCSAGGSTGDFDATNDDDCYDGNADAKPGQTNYFDVHRGDNFDYDCDNVQEEEWENHIVNVFPFGSVRNGMILIANQR